MELYLIIFGMGILVSGIGFIISKLFVSTKNGTDEQVTTTKVEELKKHSDTYEKLVAMNDCGKKKKNKKKKEKKS